MRLAIARTLSHKLGAARATTGRLLEAQAEGSDASDVAVRRIVSPQDEQLYTSCFLRRGFEDADAFAALAATCFLGGDLSRRGLRGLTNAPEKLARACRANPPSAALLASLPPYIRRQLMLERQASDDKAQLSQIETERLLAELVRVELRKRRAAWASSCRWTRGVNTRCRSCGTTVSFSDSHEAFSQVAEYYVLDLVL